LTNLLGNGAICHTFVAEATLTKRYAVKWGTAANGIIAPTAITDVVPGILVDSGVTGDHLSVCVFGEVQAIAGAAVSAGEWVGIDTTGRIVPAAATSYMVGWAMEPVLAANSYVRIFVMKTGVPKA